MQLHSRGSVGLPSLHCYMTARKATLLTKPRALCICTLAGCQRRVAIEKSCLSTIVERVTERVLSGRRRQLGTLLPQPTFSGSASAAHPDSDDDDRDLVPAAALPGDLLPDPPATVTSPQLPAYPLISLKLGSSVDGLFSEKVHQGG